MPAAPTFSCPGQVCANDHAGHEELAKRGVLCLKVGKLMGVHIHKLGLDIYLESCDTVIMDGRNIPHDVLHYLPFVL